MWALSQRWYGDRLAATYAPKPVAELQQYLTAVGLTSPFWQLQP
jgi:hypothetical protein